MSQYIAVGAAEMSEAECADDPEFCAAFKAKGIELKAAAAARKAAEDSRKRNKLLLWGGVAAAVGFLVIRKA